MVYNYRSIIVSLVLTTDTPLLVVVYHEYLVYSGYKICFDPDDNTDRYLFFVSTTV